MALNTDSDRDLQARLDNFVNEMTNLKKKRSELDDQARSVKQEIDRYDRSLKVEHGALGGIKAQMEVGVRAGGCAHLC